MQREETRSRSAGASSSPPSPDSETIAGMAAAARRTRPPGADEEPPLRHPRYEDRGVLGSGGQGIVHRAWDRELEREVALKTIRAAGPHAAAASAFLAEAHAVAALEHPNIVPIHDIGRLDDRRPFYTMRLVTGRTLGAILAGPARSRAVSTSVARAADGSGESGPSAGAGRVAELAESTGAADVAEPDEATGVADSPESGEWSLVRLVQIVQQVCRALQFAHDRGVLHRDVKPANVMVGHLGEVLLVDWGIARRGHAQRPAATRVEGTLAYMSPEQVRCDALDARADVYSLGVVLFEALALALPFPASGEVELLKAIAFDQPPHPQAVAPPGRTVPPDLADLALRCLAKRPEDRMPSAAALHDGLQAFLEGVRDHERRVAAASLLRAQGDAEIARHDRALAEIERLKGDVARLEQEHPAWEPISRKRPLLDARRQLEATHDLLHEAFVAAVDRYTDAIAHLPDDAGSRRALADMHWRRFLEVEAEGDRAQARTCLAVVERYHDGRYARELEGRGSVRVEVHPKDAEVTLHRLVERDLVLTDDSGEALGRGGVDLPDLPMGTYVLVARSEGFEPARYPVLVGRNTEWAGELRLLPQGALPPGFVYLPGSLAWLGGTRGVSAGLPPRRVFVESFALARHPVTFAEYCRFLDDLDGAGVEQCMPRTISEGPLCARDASGRHVPLPEVLMAGEPDRAAAGVTLVERFPAMAVDWHSAKAYSAWRSEVEGGRFRLPTGDEREFAARGVDGRLYPWGHVMDVTLCHVRESRPGPAVTQPVGWIPTDRSPHGVQDLAGCIQEWTASWYDEAQGYVETRGGGWASTIGMARGHWRGFVSAGLRNTGLGFRLALDVTAA